MATSLTTYTGNAGLGQGSNPNIAVISPNSNLDVLNNTASQLRNQDYESNLRIFNQKISDRDTLREMLAKGITASGEIDEQDRPIYDAAEQKTIDAFHNIKSLNDQKSIEDFYKNATHLNDIVTHAQERNLSLKQLKAEQSQQTLPFKQQAYSDFINSQRKKSFEERIDPYQQTFSFNTKPILDLYTTDTKSYDSADGLFHFDDTVGDYNQTLKNAQSKYLENGETAEDMRQLFDKFQKYNPAQQKEAIDALDAQIDKYNADTGNAIKHIQRQELTDADGNLRGIAIQEQIPDFAAKFALANQPSYLTSAKKFNDKYGTYQINLGKAAVDDFYKRAMASAALQKAGAYAANLRQQMKLRANAQEQDDFLNQLYTRNLVQQNTLVQETGNNRRDFKNIDAQSSLPIFTLRGKNVEQLIPIGATYDAISKTYKGGHYEPQYMLDGKPVSITQVSDLYKNFKKVAGRNWNQSFDDFVKQAVEAGKFKVLLKGANGMTDEDLSRAAQQIISNVNTKKGQEGVFETPPLDDQAIPTETAPQE